MKLTKRGISALSALVLIAGVFSTNGSAVAENDSVDLLEQARAKAREMEEFRSVLNGPDQNMRLATFDVMVNSGDEATRQMAIETGLASADSLLQSMALKEVILTLSSLVLSLELEGGQSEEIRAKAKNFLDTKGHLFTIPISEPDRRSGTFGTDRTLSGQVSGTTLSFEGRAGKGRLSLIDDSTLKGTVVLRVDYYDAYSYTATTKIR